MRRREFLKAAGLGALASSFDFAAVTVSGKPEAAGGSVAPGALRGFPVLMNPEADALSVVWLSTGDCCGVVEYGDAPDRLTKSAVAQRHGIAVKSAVHHVRLTDLPTGVPVYYRVLTRRAPRDPGILAHGDTYAFTLPAIGATTVRFAQINDTHENFPVLDRLLARIAGLKPDFFVWNGDIFNAVGNTEHIIKNVLLPVDRPFAATIPMVFARGNHDLRKNAMELPAYVGMPHDRFHYSFRCGPAAFVVLDTAVEGSNNGDMECYRQYRGEQAVWLDDAFAPKEISSAPVKIGLFHIPLWSKNDWHGTDSRSQWLPKLEKHGVGLLISGHTHVYEYLEKGALAATKRYDPDAPPVSIPQLVGGGPAVGEARLILIDVKGGEVAITVEDIDGRVVANHALP